MTSAPDDVLAEAVKIFETTFARWEPVYEENIAEAEAVEAALAFLAKRGLRDEATRQELFRRLFPQ